MLPAEGAGATTWWEESPGMSLPDSYRIRTVSLDHASDLVPPWAELVGGLTPTTFHFPDPNWLQACFARNASDLSLIALEDEARTVGVLPVLTCQCPLNYALGGVALGTHAVSCLRVLGGVPALPENAEVCRDLLWETLRGSDGHVLYLENIPVDAFLWKEVCQGRAGAPFRCYRLREPEPRYYIRVEGSIGDYLGRFSAKTRKNRLREARRLADAAATSVVRISQPGDVDAFVDAASAISRRTYQYRDLGLGINDVELFRGRLVHAAARGWLRSYLLTCNGMPAAFVIGYQYNRTYYYSNVGYVPEWSPYSVGSVLLLEVLSDLHADNSPAMVDFGPGGGYKEYYSTGSYAEVDAILYQPTPKVTAAIGFHHACRVANRKGAQVLDRFNMRAAVKRMFKPTLPRG